MEKDNAITDVRSVAYEHAGRMIKNITFLHDVVCRAYLVVCEQR